MAASVRAGQHIEVTVADHLASVVARAAGPAGRDDPRAAAASLADAIERTGDQLGTDHPDVLAATRVLAALHRQVGELPEARSLLENALAAGQFTRGERDPVMIGLAFDLAYIAHELENRHEARRNFERVRRHGPAVLGPEHEYVRVAQRYLGGPSSGPPVMPPPTGAQPVAAAQPVAPPPTAPPHVTAAPAPAVPAPERAQQPSPAPHVASPPAPSVGRVPIRHIPAPAEPQPAPRAVAAARSPVTESGPAEAVTRQRHDADGDRSVDSPAQAPTPSEPPSSPEPASLVGADAAEPAPPEPESDPAPATSPAAPTPPAAPTSPDPPASDAPSARAAEDEPTPVRVPEDEPTPVRTPARQAAPARPAPELLVPLRPVPAHRHGPVAAPPAPRQRKRSRIPLILLAVVLALAVLSGSAALVIAFLASEPRRDAGPPAGPSASASSAPSAIRLTLDDKGATVALGWTDPSGGRMPFVVSYGRAEGPADRTERVQAGTTTLSVNQLNPAQDYCFTVEVDDPAAGVAPSPTVCTNRARPSASPSR